MGEDARRRLAHIQAEWAVVEEAREACLQALGEGLVVEATYRGSDGTWLATSVGLVHMSVAPTPDGMQRILADVTAWQDVRDPELRIEGLSSAAMGATLTSTFDMQIPRFHAIESGGTRDLVSFARAVLRHYRGA